MYHSTSGKAGFESFRVAVDLVIDKETMRRILIREDELRASEEIQEAYSQKDDLGWFRDVTNRLQNRVLEEFGITDPRGKIVLNNARFEYKDDPSMNKLTVYMREDKSRKGHLNKGDLAPDCQLLTDDGKETTLFKYMESLNNSLPLVMFVGSAS